MNAAEELVELIRENRSAWATNSDHRKMEESQAAAIVAAGFRKVNDRDASAVERVANVLIEDGAFGVPWGDASEKDRAEAMDKAHVLLEAAGYRKPRTITTAEELDALPELSVVIDCDGDPWQKDEGAWSNGPQREGSGLLAIYAPLVIVHSPELAA